MPEATLDHAGGRRYPRHPEIAMGLNKLRHGKGDRDAAPRPVRAEDARRARKQGGDGEGRQFPSIPGQAELYPTPKGSAAGQGLLF